MRTARQSAIAAAAAATPTLPAHMRSGLRAHTLSAGTAASASGAPGGSEGGASNSTVQPTVPVALGSWWV
jgi:hypothetical protein